MDWPKGCVQSEQPHGSVWILQDAEIRFDFYCVFVCVYMSIYAWSSYIHLTRTSKLVVNSVVALGLPIPFQNTNTCSLLRPWCLYVWRLSWSQSRLAQMTPQTIFKPKMIEAMIVNTYNMTLKLREPELGEPAAIPLKDWFGITSDLSVVSPAAQEWMQNPESIF